MTKNNFIPATFTLGEQDYKGYHDPSVNWNGFAVPYFDLTTGAQILKDCGSDSCVMPEINIDGITYASIGGYEWCWEVVEQEYLVRWDIELFAKSPEEAARIANEWLTDWHTRCRTFHVIDKDNNAHSVDLTEKVVKPLTIEEFYTTNFSLNQSE